MRYIIDFGGLAVLLLNLAAGYWFGLLRRAFSLAGLFAAVALASLIGNGVARYFHGSGHPDDLYADAIAFVAIVAAVVAAAELLGYLYHDKITRIASLMFDRTVGGALGLLVGALEIGVCCLVAFAVGSATPASLAAPLPPDRATVGDAARESILGGRANQAEAGLRNLFKPVLPSDLPAHLADSAAKQ